MIGDTDEQPQLKLRTYFIGPNGLTIQSDPESLAEFRGKLKAPYQHEILNWWVDALEDGKAPTVLDVAPNVVPRAMPWAVLMKHVGLYEMRIRLAGESLRAAFNYQIHKDVGSSPFFSEDTLHILVELTDKRIAAGTHVPVIFAGDIAWPSGGSYPFQCLFLHVRDNEGDFGSALAVCWVDEAMPRPLF